MILAKGNRETQSMITIKSARFSTVEVEEERIITMSQGMIGFPHCKRYVMLDNIKDTPFIWLHAVDNPSLCFVIVDPCTFKSDYAVELDETAIEKLHVTDREKLLIMVTITIPEDISGMTANLKGPIIINPENRLAKQIVLVGDEYPTRYEIFQSNTQPKSTT